LNSLSLFFFCFFWFVFGSLNRLNPKDPVPEQLNFEQLLKAVGGTGAGALPDGFLDSHRGNLHPRNAGMFEFWAEADKSAWKNVGVGEGQTNKSANRSPAIFHLSVLIPFCFRVAHPNHRRLHLCGPD
jgi:hypothetical protein